MANNSLTRHHLTEHTRFLTLIILIAIVVLAAGEYYLFRKELALNKMVSEGIFQLKEEMKANNAMQMQRIQELINPQKR
jgi:hypothetical protein